jgi:hypothetical protein
MAMRAFRRNLNYAQRTRMLDDPEFRRSELRRIQEEARLREVADFVQAYHIAYSRVELLPQFLASRAGAYFPIPGNVYLKAAQASILDAGYTLFVQDVLGHLVNVQTPFDWDPLAQVWGYHPPLEIEVAERYDPFNPERSRLV